MVAVNAVVSVALFDQNLDQKIDLGWPGLAWVKPWAGPASPGLGPGQVLGKLAHLSFFFARLLQKGAFLGSFDQELAGNFLEYFCCLGSPAVFFNSDTL